MENTDRILDMAEDMAVVEYYFSQVIGWEEDNDKSAALPAPPSLHNELLADQIERIVRKFATAAITE